MRFLILLAFFPLVGAQASSPSFLIGTTFTAELKDGQRLTGTLPDTLQAETKFGKVVLQVERIRRIEQGADHTIVHFTNNDLIHATLTGAIPFKSTIGAEFDLLKTPFKVVQRMVQLSVTDWSEAVAGLRARLRVVDLPLGTGSLGSYAGEIVFLMELQNTTKANLTVPRPEAHEEVIPLEEMDEDFKAQVWLTRSMRRHHQDRSPKRIQRQARRVDEVILKPGGILAYRIVVPVQSGGVDVEALAQLADETHALPEDHSPTDLRIETSGTELVRLDGEALSIRGFFKLERNAQNSEKVWHGSLMTPALNVDLYSARRAKR